MINNNQNKCKKKIIMKLRDTFIVGQSISAILCTCTNMFLIYINGNHCLDSFKKLSLWDIPGALKIGKSDEKKLTY